MAKATVTHVSDDIDGTPDAETITFGFQGVAYSIDLSPKNFAKLTKALAPFIQHATQARGPARPARRARPAPPAPSARTAKVKAPVKAARSYDLVQLREWAGKNKIAVPSRGRIPAAVVEQYQRSGGK